MNTNSIKVITESTFIPKTISESEAKFAKAVEKAHEYISPRKPYQGNALDIISTENNEVSYAISHGIPIENIGIKKHD